MHCKQSSCMDVDYYCIVGKFGGDNVWRKWINILAKKVWQMNRLAKRLLIVTANLHGFSLANR